MATIKYQISDKELHEIYLNKGLTPIEVAVRLRLNSYGIKFKDDNLPSAITNTKPVPLGCLKCIYFVHKGISLFVQEIE